MNFLKGHFYQTGFLRYPRHGVLAKLILSCFHSKYTLLYFAYMHVYMLNLCMCIFKHVHKCLSSKL